MRNNSLIEKNHLAPNPPVVSSRDGPLIPDFERCLEWARLCTAYARTNKECIDKHQQTLRELNETELRLKALPCWRESDAFTELEKAALSLTEAISLQETEVISELVLKDSRRHFSNEEIVRLTLTVIAVNDWIELHGRPVRILVVEDSEADQELLVRQLVKARMADNVLFVSDGLQAMKLIERSSGSDSGLIAIFLDLHLPGLSGLEILQRVRALPGMEDFPVIVMTSSNHPNDIERCRKLKVASYVQKPVTYDSFSHAVANFFQRPLERECAIAGSVGRNKRNYGI